MALTKTSVVLLASTAVAAGLTKATASASAWFNTQTYYRSCVRFSLTNGSAAPGAPPTFLVQTSPDNGTTIYDEYPVGGDTIANSLTTGEIAVDDTTMYVRVLVYGNTTNSITAQASLQAITAL